MMDSGYAHGAGKEQNTRRTDAADEPGPDRGRRPASSGLLRKILVFAAVITAAFISSFLAPASAHAYTREQKEAAKAWLSSHGYPPTEDGAWQAYSDWLDGKWWDEFGSPDEYYGRGDDDGEEEEESPTAATQKSETEDQDRGKGAETLVDVMHDDDGEGRDDSGNGENGGNGEDAGTDSETPDAETTSEERSAEESSEKVQSSEDPAASQNAGPEAGTAESASEETEPTAATQADINDMVEAVSDSDTDRGERTLPFAIGGMSLVALLLVGFVIWDRRR